MAGCAAPPPPQPAAPAEAPDAAGNPLLELAEEALARGELPAARAHLEAAPAADPSRHEAHARLAALTGRAPRASAGNARDALHALRMADAHPYDPRAVLQAGRLLARAGRTGPATIYRERVLWLADLDPPAAGEAAEWLARIDPAWRDRRVVPVHVFADEIVRARFGWAFRLRNLWLAVSNALRDVLEAHEILHLYAGVHVAEDIESLMNPTGEALVLDAFNARIVRAMRPRRFGDGGLPGDILPWVDLEEATAALRDSLAANLTLRRMGLDRAVRSSEYSRFQAAREWSQARQLDPHLGDVSLFLAHLELADARAQALRAELRRHYGDGPGEASREGAR